MKNAVARLKSRQASLTVEQRNAICVYGTTATFGIEQAGIITYLPVFLARAGASAGQIALLTSLPAVVSMLILIPAGLFTERFADQVRLRGRTSFIVRSSFLLMALAPAVFPIQAIPLVAISVWIFRALAMSVSNSAWMTVISSAIPARQRPRVNSFRWALLGLVSALLAAVFGSMLDAVAFPLNYQALFLISFAGGLVNLYFFSRIRVPLLDVKPRSSRRTAPLKNMIVSYVSSIRESREFVRYLLGTIVFRIALNMALPLFSIYWVNELRASDGLIGLRGTAGYATLVIGYLAWGKITNRWKHRRGLWTCALLYGLYPISTALVPSASWLPAVAVLWGAAVSGVDIGLFDLMMAATPREMMPRFSSVLNLVSNGAALVGPVLGATLSSATSLQVALLVVGVLQLLSTATFWLLPSDV